MSCSVTQSASRTARLFAERHSYTNWIVRNEREIEAISFHWRCESFCLHSTL